MAEKGQKTTHTLKYNLRTRGHILPPDAQCEERMMNFIDNRRGAPNKMQVGFL